MNINTKNPSNPENNEQKNRINALDGLRAFAIIFVILAHSVRAFSNQITITIGPVDLHNPLYNGWAGVDLFFVLSGFLITSQLLHKTLNKQNLKTYAFRRFFRIAPSYYVIVLATLITFYFIPEIGENSLYSLIQKWWFALFSHIIFLHDYIGRAPSINGIFWSIPIEIKFYMILPVAIIVITKIKSPTHQAITSLLIFTLYALTKALFLYINYGGETIDYETYFHDVKTPFHFALDGLIIGVTCAFILNSNKIKALKKSSPLIDRIFITGLLLFSANALWPHLTNNEAVFFEYSLMTPLLAISFGMMLFSLVHGCFATNFFSNKLLCFIAKISYCLYLTHLFTIPIQNKISELILPYFSSPTLCWLVILPIFLILSILPAYALHKTVEKPFLDWSKKRFAYGN